MEYHKPLFRFIFVIIMLKLVKTKMGGGKLTKVHELCPWLTFSQLSLYFPDGDEMAFFNIENTRIPYSIHFKGKKGVTSIFFFSESVKKRISK